MYMLFICKEKLVVDTCYSVPFFDTVLLIIDSSVYASWKHVPVVESGLNMILASPFDTEIWKETYPSQ